MTAYDQIKTLLSTRGTGDGNIIVKESVLRAFVEEHEALQAEKPSGSFDLFDHLSVPSRDKPIAAAAAVNMRRSAL